jgi:hypothetical protein
MAADGTWETTTGDSHGSIGWASNYQLSVSELRPAANSPASGIIGSNTSPAGDTEHLQVSFMKSHEALHFLSRAVQTTTVLSTNMKMGNIKNIQNINKHSHCHHFVAPHC